MSQAPGEVFGCGYVKWVREACDLGRGPSIASLVSLPERFSPSGTPYTSAGTLFLVARPVQRP